MTDPLTDEEIEDCRAWVSGVYFTGTEPGDFSDIDTLRWLATIDALRAEVERLKREAVLEKQGSFSNKLADAWDEARAQAISLAKDEHMHRSHGCCRETLEDLWEDLAAMPNTYRCEEESTDD